MGFKQLCDKELAKISDLNVDQSVVCPLDDLAGDQTLSDQVQGCSFLIYKDQRSKFLP